MKLPHNVLILAAIVLAGCTKQANPADGGGASATAELEAYFQGYCNYTGSLGIGFVPSHTYDYRFRQHLRTTDDPELKRLYVLMRLFRDVESKVRLFEQGLIVPPKSRERTMTPEEFVETYDELSRMIDDLEAFTAMTENATVLEIDPDACDPARDKSEIMELRRRLKAAHASGPRANKAE